MLQHQLIEECRQNSRKAQMQLYNKYRDGMYTVAFRFLRNSFEAEEAMQEAFIKAFQKLHQYKGEVSFGAWLKKIVVNKSIDILKSRQLEIIALNENILIPVEEEENWQIAENFSIEDCRREIEALPDKYKYALMLYLVEGYDHQEISEILNISEVASRTLVHRGRKMLQEQLKSKSYGTGY